MPRNVRWVVVKYKYVYTQSNTNPDIANANRIYSIGDLCSML